MTDARARLIGINHVALEVGDIDEALTFYGDLFGFELRGRVGERMAFLDAGDQFVALSASPPADADRDRHVGFVVDSRDAFWRPRGRRACSCCPAAGPASAIRGATRSRSCSTTRCSSPRLRGCCAGWGWRELGKTPEAVEELREKGLADGEPG